MQFLLLIYDQEKRWTERSQAEQFAEYQEYAAFGKEFEKAIRNGNALEPTKAAKTVRVRNGKRMVTDGPFAETKEQLGGYYVARKPHTAEEKNPSQAALAPPDTWLRPGPVAPAAD
jgi:hypothetical protein